MAKHDQDERFLSVTIPARPELASIEEALESLSDLAGRRDALRLIAERAASEATKLDQEFHKILRSHQRGLAALGAQHHE